NQVLRKVNISTTAVTTIAGVAGSLGATDGAANTATFRSPNGICISSDGQILYIADAGNHKIRKLDLGTQTVSTVAGNGTAGYIDNIFGSLSEFNNPQGVTLLHDDSLLIVSDTYNNRIRQIEFPSTAVTTL